MDPSRYARVKEIVLAASALPAAERAAYLRQACGDDAWMAAEAASLLSHADAQLPAVAPVVSNLPARIGGYRILGILGEGGMGVVYHAEQQEPVRREVALKVIRDGFGGPGVLARFESERQTLALMEHPGIARLLDASSTEDGRPFFVMDVVRGVPINEYCRTAGLDVRARLLLFLDVCRAVRHAHRRGVIHRDLKPSNVLVTVEQGQPVVKVIDFSIAKALQDPGFDTQFRTRTGQIIGTLEYMSPEQARGDVAAVDLRTDVYSLGVLLYELLTGRLPHELSGTPLHEAVRRIVQDPPKPMQEARLTLTRTRTDRETIVLKCLEKEPDRRYGSAAELAEDLERTLDSRPILARPSSTAYQLRKLVGRHRVAFGFLATVLVLLVAFSATVTIQLAIQNRERARAETAARREQRINAFFHSMLAAASPEERGRDVTVRQVLDAAAVQLDKDTVDEPAVEAALRETIGTTYRALEAIPQAEAFLREALRIRTEYLGPDHPDLGDSHLALARLYILQTRFLEAEQEADLALRVYQQLSQRRPLATARALLVRGSARTHLVRWAEAKRDLQEALRLLEDEVRVTPANEIEHAEFLETYAYLLWRQIVGWEEGERLQRRALAIRLRHLGTEHATVLTARHWLAVYVGAQDRFTEAESIFREVLAIRRRVLDPETLATGRTLQMLAETRNSLGGRLQETEALLREAMAIRRRAWGERAPNVGEDLSLLADVRAQRGSFEEAIALARQGLAIQEAYWDPVHQKTAAARCTLALVLHQAGGLDEAEALARSCVVMGDEIFGHRNDYTTLGGLALLHRILLAQGRTGEVEPILDRLGTACAPDSGAARICWAAKLSAGETLLGQGRPEEAVRTLQEGLARVRPGADGGRRRTRLLSTLADALRAAGRPAEALPHAQAAVAIQRAAPEWDMLDRAQALLALGRVQAALGARNEAAAVARELTGLVRSGKVREVSLVAGIRGLHEGP